MKDEKLPQVKQYISKHKKMSVWYKLVTTLAAIVVFATTYMLILPAITLERKPVCGMEEHIHDESCLEVQQVLVCELEEEPEHHHDDNCYDDEGNLVCGLEETEGHTHGDECYEEQQVLVCGLEEHIHSDECYADEDVTEDETETEEETEVSTDTTASSDDEENTEATTDHEPFIGEDDDEVTTVFENTEIAIVETTEEETETTTEALILNNIDRYDDVASASAMDPVRVKDVQADPDSGNVLTVTGASYSNASFDTSEGLPKADVNISFTASKEQLAAGKYIEGGAGEDCREFYIKLPEDMTFVSTLAKNTDWLNKDDALETDRDKYYYSFVTIDGKDYIHIKMKDSTIAEMQDASYLNGTIHFGANFGSSLVDDEGSIRAVFPNSNNVQISINNGSILYPDYTNGQNDVRVQKSNATFDADNSTVSYTVTIFSRSGTGNEIDFSDVATLNDVTVVGTPQVEVKEGLYYKNLYNSSQYVWEAGGNVSGTPSFDASTNTLTMTLDPLAKSTEKTDKGDPKMHAYRITYTYTLDGVNVVEEGQQTTQTISNTAHVDVKDKTINDEHTITGTPIGINKKHIVVKSGSCDDDGVVSWTIVLGDGETDLQGYYITDLMLGEADAGTLEVLDVNGDPVDPADYTFDGNGKITINTTGTKYTINYTTTFSGPSETKADNTVDVYDPDDEQADSRGVSVGNSGKYFSKEYLGLEVNPADTTGATQLANWKVEVNIPEEGYSAGTYFYDYTEGGESDHYFTKETANALKAALEASYPGVFTLQVRQADEWGVYKTPDELTGNAAEVRLTLNTDLAQGTYTDDKLTFEYSTVVNTGAVTNSKSYTNKFSGVNTQASDWFEYRKRVVKQSENKRTSKTEVENVDGKIAWRVEVLLDENIAAGTEIKVTDTLPDGLRFLKTSASIGEWGGDDNSVVYDSSGGGVRTEIYDKSYKTHACTFDASTGTLTVTVGSTGIEATESNPQRLYIYYQCIYDDAADVPVDTKQTFELTNNVMVEMDNDLYGVDSHTQDLIVDKTMDDKPVSKKDPVFDMENNLIRYTVEMNPAGETFNSEGGPLRLNDQFWYQTRTSKDTIDPEWAQYMDIELAYESVKLYYATSTKVYNSATQKNEWVMTKGEEVPATDWRWTSQTSEDTGNPKTVTIGLFAEMPDETPLIIEYAYRVKDFSSNVYGSKELKVNNKAHLYGDDYTDYEESEKSSKENNWVQNEHGGTAGYKPRYSICKISENNYAMKLDGAVFGLYQYDASTGTYINTGKTFRTGTDGTGIVQITFDATTGLLPNTLYYVTEIEAPVGYVLPSDPEKLYFYMNSSDESISNFPPASDPAMAKAIDVTTKEYVKNIKNEELGNDVTQIQVEKEWYDSENRKFIKTDGSINCSLYRRMNDLSQSANSKTVNLVATDKGNVQQTVNKYAIPGAKITLLYRNNAMHDYQEEYFKFPYVKIVNGGVTILDKQTTADDWIVDVDNNIAEYQFTSTGDVDITASVDFNFGTSSGMDMLVNELDVPLTDDDKHYVTEKVRDFDLTADNDWMISFDDLQKYGEYHGRSTKYTYFVVENTATDGYEVSYWFDGSKYTAEQLEALEIEEGRITIRNTSEGEDETFVLPSTGGMGTYPFTFGGIAVLTAALLFYLRKKAV